LAKSGSSDLIEWMGSLQFTQDGKARFYRYYTQFQLEFTVFHLISI